MLMGEGDYHTYRAVEKHGLKWRWADIAGERAAQPDGRVTECYIQCEDAVAEDWLIVIDGILPPGASDKQAFHNGKRIGKPLEDIAIGYRWMILQDLEEDTPIAEGEAKTLGEAQRAAKEEYDRRTQANNLET